MVFDAAVHAAGDQTHLAFIEPWSCWALTAASEKLPLNGECSLNIARVKLDRNPNPTR